MGSHPALYEINTRVLLRETSRRFGRQATFDDIPDQALRTVAELGFEWVWFLGVWRTGEAGRTISRQHPSWQDAFRRALPDLEQDDICGSPFAIAGFEVEPAFGGNEALARLRERCNRAGLRLMLDFVPNHVAPDHPWVASRPSLFIAGSEAQLADEPQNWMRVGDAILAHGRDPYFPGWPDTVQLDYANPETRAAMADVLLALAGQCDGLRCDMAMLLLPEVFGRTWQASLGGRTVGPFWPDALARLRDARPGFRMLAEVYWDLEPALLDLGFDWAYDKGLYDSLRGGDAPRARQLLAADQGHQARLARFLENHDEPRAAAIFGFEQHKAAAVLTYCAPGLRFFHQGQLDGARAHIPVHLDRAPPEGIDRGIHEFYLDLLSALRDPVLRQGRYEPLAVQPAWDGNPSFALFVASLWFDEAGARMLCVVNYSPHRGQARLRLTDPTLQGRVVALSDRLGREHYARDGSVLLGEGLYVDLPGWGYNLFAIG